MRASVTKFMVAVVAVAAALSWLLLVEVSNGCSGGGDGVGSDSDLFADWTVGRLNDDDDTSELGRKLFLIE